MIWTFWTISRLFSLFNGHKMSCKVKKTAYIRQYPSRRNWAEYPVAGKGRANHDKGEGVVWELFLLAMFSEGWKCENCVNKVKLPPGSLYIIVYRAVSNFCPFFTARMILPIFSHVRQEIELLVGLSLATRQVGIPSCRQTIHCANGIITATPSEKEG